MCSPGSRSQLQISWREVERASLCFLFTSERHLTWRWAAELLSLPSQWYLLIIFCFILLLGLSFPLNSVCVYMLVKARCGHLYLPQRLSILFLRHGSSLNRELAESAWLAGQWAPGIHLSLPSSPRITECRFSHVYFPHFKYLMIFIAFVFSKSFSINPVIYVVWGAIAIGRFDRFFFLGCLWLSVIFMTWCMLSTFERTIWIWLFIFNYAELALATLKIRGLWANLVFLRCVSVYYRLSSRMSLTSELVLHCYHNNS